MELIDDLLGPAPTPPKTRAPRKTKKVDDLLGPAPRKARQATGSKRKYVPLKVPKVPAPGGIFAAREEKGKNLGRTCLVCKDELKHKRGRPPVVCRKKSCFRAYRNLYRHDYDRARA